MSSRKYTVKSIGQRVNISSTGHYSFMVWIEGYRCKWLRWDGYGTFWTETAYPSFPKYVMQALEALLLERLRADDTVWYENDQYGGTRTTNLRYHDPELVSRWADRLEGKLKNCEAGEPAL